MKKINAFISVYFLVSLIAVGNTNSFAQTKPTVPILDRSSAAKICMAVSLLDTEIQLNGGSSIYKMDSTAVTAAATGEYADFISKALKGLEFEYSNPKHLSPIPVKFSGSECLLFRFASSSVFNENKFSDRELAKRICSDMILPDFYQMSDAFEVNCPKYIGIGIAYRTKDFTEKYDSGDSNSLIIISSKENIKKLVSYEITDNKFLENSFILLYKNTDGKRIELQL